MAANHVSEDLLFLSDRRRTAFNRTLLKCFFFCFWTVFCCWIVQKIWREIRWKSRALRFELMKCRAWLKTERNRKKDSRIREREMKMRYGNSRACPSWSKRSADHSEWNRSWLSMQSSACIALEGPHLRYLTSRSLPCHQCSNNRSLKQFYCHKKKSLFALCWSLINF